MQVFPSKQSLSVRIRLGLGAALNLVLAWYATQISGYAYSSGEYSYIARDIVRDSISCFLPLVSIPILLPVIIIARGRERLLAIGLLVLPTVFACVAWWCFGPELLGREQ